MTEAPIQRTTPYCGPAPALDTLPWAWNGDPALLSLLGLAAGLGVWRLHSAASRRKRVFGLAWVIAVIAFVSPLCALTVALFAARGLHHLLLVFAMAPALAMALPLRRMAGAPGFVLLSGALWAWHVPAVYAAAWDHAAVYWGLQAALILPAWAFWSGILCAPGSLGRQLAAGLQLAGLAGQMGLIGAILTFSPSVLYPEHLGSTAAFGLDPLHDQHLAGLVMWVPGMVPLALAAAIVLRRAWGTDGAGHGNRSGDRADQGGRA